MYRQEVYHKDEGRDCDICHKPVRAYIDNFRIDVCFPDKKIILGNDLFTLYLCHKCLADEVKKEIIKQLDTYKKGAYSR